MSLEERLAENTAAMKELAEAIKASNIGREAALETARALANGGEAAKPRKKKDEPAAGGGDAGAGAGDDAPKTPTAPTVDELRSTAAAFLGLDAEKEADKLDARKTFVKGLITKFEADKIVNIPEGNRAEVIAAIKGYSDPAPKAADDDMLGD